MKWNFVPNLNVQKNVEYFFLHICKAIKNMNVFKEALKTFLECITGFTSLKKFRP